MATVAVGTVAMYTLFQIPLVKVGTALVLVMAVSLANVFV
jgi:hypothetical protein